MSIVNDLIVEIYLANFYKKHQKFDIISQIQYRKRTVKNKIRNKIEKTDIDKYVLKDIIKYIFVSDIDFKYITANISDNLYILNIKDEILSVQISISRNPNLQSINICLDQNDNPFTTTIIVDSNFVYWGTVDRYNGILEDIKSMIKSTIITYLYTLIDY